MVSFMLAHGFLNVEIQKQLLRIPGLLVQNVAKERLLNGSQKRIVCSMVVHVILIVTLFPGISQSDEIAQKMVTS